MTHDAGSAATAVTSDAATAEIAEKRRRVHALLAAEDLDALVLRSPANVAWYSAGGRSHILATPEVGEVDLVVTRDGERAVTTVSEHPRVAEEELAALGIEVQAVAWDADRTALLPSGERIGTDVPLPGRRTVAGAVSRARQSLTPAEADRFRDVGRRAGAALTDAALAAVPDATEYDAAAALAAALVRRGLDPVVLQVAGAARLDRYRHVLPTAAPLGRRFLLSVCARGGGLVASLTRLVCFGPPEPAWADALERLLHVDAAFVTATRPGARVGEIFAAGTAAYARHGFAADEWRRHHQGGPAGYAPRDYLATAASDADVVERQAFAWNPSAPGVKSEDTILAVGGAAEILTADPRWPTRDAGGVPRPWLLER